MLVRDENTPKEHIKEVRAKNKWSRYELSRQTNVGESTIRTWETGKNPISPCYIQFLAALGYEIRIKGKTVEHEGMITVIKELGEIIADLRDRIDYLKWEIKQHNKNRTHDKEKIAELKKQLEEQGSYD